MEKPKFSASDYLRQKAERSGLTQEEIKQQYPHWFRPLGGEAIKAKDLQGPNLIEVEEGNLKIALLTSNLSDRDQEFFQSTDQSHRKIKDLVFVFADKEVLSVQDLLPSKDIAMIFRSDATAKSFDAQLVLSRKGVNSKFSMGIDLGVSPLYPHSILSLLHEIGHANDLLQDGRVMEVSRAIRKFAQVSFQAGNKPTAKDGRIFLEAERNAWAYALKYCRKIFNAMSEEFNQEEMLRIVHQGALHSYSSDINQKLLG